jgi:hypothetical protein
MSPILAARRACAKSQDAAGTAILPSISADFAGQPGHGRRARASYNDENTDNKGQKK